MPSEVIRFVDLCAGLGGFHRGISLAERAARRAGLGATRFECVLAAELDPELRRLYVENFPSIKDAYRSHHAPAQVRELGTLDDLYTRRGRLLRVHGDIHDLVDVSAESLRCWPDTGVPLIPEHELLCAGFPCQPFSKSGAQRGFEDLNGTVFRLIALVLKHRKPDYAFLENVGNFERHDGGNTWKRVHGVLEELGYDWRATTHVGSQDGGQGLLSPHHLGFAHHRERFFIVAQRRDTVGAFQDGRYPFPKGPRQASDRKRAWRNVDQQAAAELRRVLSMGEARADREELVEAELNPEREATIRHWNRLLKAIDAYERQRVEREQTLRPLPSFPVWGYELDPWQWYPADSNPKDWAATPERVTKWRVEHLERMSEHPAAAHPPRGSAREFLAARELGPDETRRWISLWPGYAGKRDEWPDWKVKFIRSNRDWSERLWSALDPAWLRAWLDELFGFLASHQKLEWNCQGEKLDLWQHILQFRPSGLRVKRLRNVPALVAMTTTQIPIVPRFGPVNGRAPSRHILGPEALALQGFPFRWRSPANKQDRYRAFGNAVHAKLVSEIVLSWLFEKDGPYDNLGRPLSARESEASPAAPAPSVGPGEPAVAPLPGGRTCLSTPRPSPSSRLA